MMAPPVRWPATPGTGEVSGSCAVRGSLSPRTENSIQSNSRARSRAQTNCSSQRSFAILGVASGPDGEYVMPGVDDQGGLLRAVDLLQVHGKFACTLL